VLREITQFPGNYTCDTVLEHFQRGHSHIAFIVEIVQSANNDPQLRKVGLATLEDIVEEILDEEIEDDFDDGELVARDADFKNEKQFQKEQLVALFLEHKAGKVLTQNEIDAVTEFLSAHVTAFQATKLHHSALQKIVNESDVLEIESDDRPYSHLVDQYPNAVKKTKVTMIKTESKESKKHKEPHVIGGSAPAPKKISDDDVPSHTEIVSPDKIEVAVNNSMEMVPEEQNDIEAQNRLDTEQVQEHVDGLINPKLYTRGLSNDNFYLILSGKVMICAGQEGFMISHTSFNYIGEEALLDNDYKPDFSAKVVGQARLLRITREQYLKALASLAQMKKKTVLRKNM